MVDDRFTTRVQQSLMDESLAEKHDDEKSCGYFGRWSTTQYNWRGPRAHEGGEIYRWTRD